jgi:polyisoprenyl-phosphate glycosyltransferase
MSTQLSIVVPCFNEQEVLETTSRSLLALLASMTERQIIAPSSTVCFVDDGSRDDTWSLIESFASGEPRVRGIKLSRNRGHQIALLAGLMNVDGDAVVSIDADLQDDVSVIEEMVERFRHGADVVYGVRASRQSDSAFKRHTAIQYYKLMRRMGVELVHNHADFRLLSRRAVEAVRQYGEVNVFLRGLVPLIGFRSATVTYDRKKRPAGASKYPLRKMLSFAAEGVTSFSTLPLRLITMLGFAVSAFSFAMIVYIMYGTLVMKAVIPGWASSVLPVYFLGGIQLLAIGILGEYVGKIYMESKRRPKYFIEKVV